MLHFGHYIAMAQDNELAQFEADMRNFPFLTGFSPVRWQECYDFELLKKAGVFLVEKLRTIFLGCADFNDNNKITGRQFMRHAEDHLRIALE